jgi:protein tyrosine phosphatase
MTTTETVNRYFSEYFHPEILWKRNSLGKFKAVGAVISWTLIVIPIFMAIGLGISTLCLKNKISSQNKPGPIKNTRKLGTNSLGVIQRNFANNGDLWKQLAQITLINHSKADNLSSDEVNHRFQNIASPRHTAVKVINKYLHANHIRIDSSSQKFIATQSPLPKDYELFWNAVYNYDCTIVDLTNMQDRSPEKGVTDYCPLHLNETKQYGNFSVTLTAVKGSLQKYQVKNLTNGESKEIKRLHFLDWKDFGTITVPELTELVHEVGSSLKTNTTLVHCRAGIGRTGTLITASYLKEKIARGIVNSKNLDSALIDLIATLRIQRGPSFVQTQEQFELLRKYGLSLLN